jgi:hypothetical protein
LAFFPFLGPAREIPFFADSQWISVSLSLSAYVVNGGRPLKFSDAQIRRLEDGAQCRAILGVRVGKKTSGASPDRPLVRLLGQARRLAARYQPTTCRLIAAGFTIEFKWLGALPKIDKYVLKSKINRVFNAAMV